MADEEALYARISTSDGRQDLESQLQQLRRVSDSEDPREYTDEISGADFNRPGLDDLLEAAQKGEISKIYVAELSRLGRSLTNLDNILDRLDTWNTDLVILDMGIDTGTPAGRLFFQIAGAFAEYERELIRERVKRGMDRAKSEGKQIGRPSNHISRETLYRVQNWRNLPNGQQKSWPQISEELGIPQSTIYRKYQQYLEQRNGGDTT